MALLEITPKSQMLLSPLLFHDFWNVEVEPSHPTLRFWIRSLAVTCHVLTLPLFPVHRIQVSRRSWLSYPLDLLYWIFATGKWALGAFHNFQADMEKTEPFLFLPLRLTFLAREFRMGCSMEIFLIFILETSQ
jgi:hypothetical protein